MNLTGNNSLLNEIFYDTFIFEDTIYNNIRFGRLNAGKEEIWEVADKSRVIDFAWNLPKGLQTRVGGKFTALTASQKLRIGLARMLLRESVTLFANGQTFTPYLYAQQLINKQAILIMAQEVTMVKNDDLVLVLD